MDGTPVIDVNANQTIPNTFTTGGVTEFALTDPTIALAGSGTAAASGIVVHHNTVGVRNVGFSFRARDLENGAENAQQQVAVEYRMGSTGNWTNIALGYIADATSGPNLSAPGTLVSLILPTAAEGKADLQVRVITSNAPGNDEWVGMDDIRVTASTAPSLPTLSIENNSITRGDSGTKTLTFTVSRTGDTTGVTTVDFATSDGTSPVGSDYVATNGPLPFLAGETSKTVSVTINGDTVAETDDTFRVMLSNASGASLTLIDGSGLDTAVYAGARAKYTITRNAGLTVTATDNRGGSPDGSDTLTSMEWAQFPDTRVWIGGQKKQDLNNGDGKSDILWRNTGDQTASWDVGGGAVSLLRDYGVIDNTWAIVG